jgi:hypothetical protein
MLGPRFGGLQDEMPETCPLGGLVAAKISKSVVQHQRRIACSFPRMDMPSEKESNFTGSSRPKSRLDPRYA